MNHDPGTFQHVGSLIGAVVTTCMGIYIIVFAPKALEKRVASGAISAEAAQRARKTIRWTGPFLLVGGVILFIARFMHWT